jgi:hypothetical protein
MLTANNLIFNSQNAANGVWRDISIWQCYSIHITGIEGHVWIEVSNDPTVMTDGANIAAPLIPTLGQYTPTDGLAGVATNTTYFVKTTFVTTAGETTPSPEASLTVLAGNLLTVAAPAKDAGGYARGWNVYISKVTNTETLQNLEDNAVISPLQFSPFILKNLVSSGVVVPVSNTTGSPNAGINVTSPDIISNTTASPPLADNEAALIYDSATHQAIWSPSNLVYNFIRVRKDNNIQTLTTKAYLFGQLG